MVLTNGLTLISIGVVLGLVSSVGLTRLMASQIWGVTPTDPLTLVSVVIVVVAVGFVACVAPARAATRVDPLIALRVE